MSGWYSDVMLHTLKEALGILEDRLRAAFGR